MKSPIYGQQLPVCGAGATAGVNKNLPKLPPSDMKITKGGMTTLNGVANADRVTVNVLRIGADDYTSGTVLVEGSSGKLAAETSGPVITPRQSP